MVNFDKLKLKKFNLSDLVPNATILLLGKRRSGKSFLVRDIFYHHRNIPRGIVFSGTESANPFFGDFFPDTFIYPEYDPDLIENAMALNGKKVKEARKIYPDLSGLLPSNRFCIVLDDMLADASSWKKEKTIQAIFFNGRHYNIFFIITLQYPLGIPPPLRGNIDYVFVFNEPSIKNQKKIYDDYGGMIPTFDHFQQILKDCTENYQCLVIKCFGSSVSISDQIYWYKAKARDDFRFGHRKFWDYHTKQYNDNYRIQQDQDELDMGVQKQKWGRKLKILINKEGDVIDEYQEDD